jgi:hypothetical protein
MESDSLQAIPYLKPAFPDQRQQLCRFIEGEVEALLGTLRYYVYRANLARGAEIRRLALDLL